jgi:two-component system, OmpR family, sensor histidine kinase ArlS
MSIKWKITFLFTLLVMIICFVISLAVYFFSAAERHESFKKRLKNRALSTAKVYAGTPDGNYSALKSMDTASVASLYEKSISVIGYRNENLYVYAEKPEDSLYITQKTIERAKIEDEYYFIYKKKQALALHYTDNEHNFIVAVAAADIDGSEYLEELKRILRVVFLFSVLFSFFSGILFAKHLLRPLGRINAEVSLITSSSLSQRISAGNRNDELFRLVQNFNQLLDRLEESFTVQRRFISNASHELSTPLTSISSQLEVAMQKSRTVQEYIEVLQSVYDDVKDLQQLTRSLLDIAKTGSQGSIDLSEVRIDEVLLKVAADVQKMQSHYRVSVNFEILPDDAKLLTVYGNSNLLYIAFKNIIENGCKYSDDHHALVQASFDKSSMYISVVSKGDIIAEADIQNIFQPFFRTDSAASKPGFGLGLTLTKRILGLHKAAITVSSNPVKGTVFLMKLPNIIKTT